MIAALSGWITAELDPMEGERIERSVGFVGLCCAMSGPKSSGVWRVDVVGCRVVTAGVVRAGSIKFCVARRFLSWNRVRGSRPTR